MYYYDCQESDPIEKNDDYWKFLDEEIESGFIVHFDGNIWAVQGIRKSKIGMANFLTVFGSTEKFNCCKFSRYISECLITRTSNKNGKVPSVKKI